MQKYYIIDYDFISKMSSEELKNYFRFRGSNINGRKNRLVARAFSPSDDGVNPIKSAVEIEAGLKTEYLAKLKINGRNIPDPFKSAHGWMNEDESMKFWRMLLYPDIFTYLMSFPSELGRKYLNNYKNSILYSYPKSGWLQSLLYHNLAGSNFRLLKGECRKSRSVNNPFHKIWVILENPAKIRSWSLH